MATQVTKTSTIELTTFSVTAQTRSASPASCSLVPALTSAAITSSPRSSFTVDTNSVGPSAVVCGANSTPANQGAASSSTANERSSTTPWNWATICWTTILTIAGLVAAYLALSQGYASLSLARWTSWKDYLDVCRAQNITSGHTTESCNQALQMPIEPPPFSISTRSPHHIKRVQSVLSAVDTSSILLFSLVIAIGVVLPSALIIKLLRGRLERHAMVEAETRTDHSSTPLTWVPVSTARQNLAGLRWRGTRRSREQVSGDSEMSDWLPANNSMQYISGDNEMENFLPSKNQSSVVEENSSALDLTSPLVKCWYHLALDFGLDPSLFAPSTVVSEDRRIMPHLDKRELTCSDCIKERHETDDVGVRALLPEPLSIDARHDISGELDCRHRPHGRCDRCRRDDEVECMVFSTKGLCF